ncbi:BsaWI family type II restriction enzyme, partial [Persephonella sp.]
KRQSDATKEGEAKEKDVVQLLLSNSMIRDNFNIGKPSKVLNDKSLLYIPYNDYKAMIDADLCVVRKKDNKLVCVISVKKSFRERGGQTAYWAVKVKEFKKDYKYILATPDVDEELFNFEELHKKPKKKRKWRVILPYECDAVFVYSYSGKLYRDGNFYVGKEYFIEYIKNFL